MRSAIFPLVLRSSGATAILIGAFFGGTVSSRAQETGPGLPTARPIEVIRETRATAKAAPSSNLDARSALVAAWTIAAQIKGGRVMTVLPTGSMRPMFDEKAYLVVAPSPYENLQVGDIITFRHPRLGTPVVHRVMEKHGRSIWTKGDYNSRPDDVYVTAGNYEGRVVAVIYAQSHGA